MGAERVRILLTGVKRLVLFDKLKESPSLPMKNVENFLPQSRQDPSVSTKILQSWELELVKQLDINSLKYKYATLYSHLVKEWLTANNSTDTFGNVGRAEMHEQRVKWEDLVFTPEVTDTEAITNSLNTLFTSTKDIKVATEALWVETRMFEAGLSRREHFNDETLTYVIKGLLRTDLVTDEQKQVLKDFLGNKIVLAEVADVWNMRIKSLDKWKWDPSGTSIKQKRHLNGRYRFYAYEDLLQTILLRYLGLEWSVYFKIAFTTFRKATGVWKSSVEQVPALDRQRRDHSLHLIQANQSRTCGRRTLTKRSWSN